MKRSIVQHGPSTLTVSLPAAWAKRHGLRKGAEVVLEEAEHAITIRVGEARDAMARTVDLRGLKNVCPKIIAAVYKLGYDDVVFEYGTPDELAEIQRLLHGSFIGLEVVEESAGRVHVRSVSEPDDAEFQALLRRMFHFLLAIAEESLAAANRKDKTTHALLVPRDESINRVADFLRRIVIRHGQRDYASDCAIYYVIEQLEKCADAYKHMNIHLAAHEPLDARLLELYAQAVELTRKYVKIFWDYSPLRAKEWFDCWQEFSERADELTAHPGAHRILRIAQALFDLSGTTIMLGMSQQDAR
jgi:phosphate uptake regulator